jgi:hypothetical protein
MGLVGQASESMECLEQKEHMKHVMETHFSVGRES